MKRYLSLFTIYIIATGAALAERGIRVRVRKFPRIVLYRDPVCPACPGHSSGDRTKYSLCILCLRYPGSDAGHGPERTSPQTLQPRLTVHFNGSRVSFRCCVPSAPGSREALLERYDDPGKSPCRCGLSTHGLCAPTVNFHDCRSLGWDWLDSWCI
jgi:hypothetical protein